MLADGPWSVRSHLADSHLEQPGSLPEPDIQLHWAADTLPSLTVDNQQQAVDILDLDLQQEGSRRCPGQAGSLQYQVDKHPVLGQMGSRPEQVDSCPELADNLLVPADSHLELGLVDSLQVQVDSRAHWENLLLAVVGTGKTQTHSKSFQTN